MYHYRVAVVVRLFLVVMKTLLVSRHNHVTGTRWLMKLNVLRGTRLEDLDQHWFPCKAMWNVKQVTDNNVKMEQLTTMFRDRALNQFMKYTEGQARTLQEVKVALTADFKKPKSESQCITKLKEIKQKLTETIWKFNQKFKIHLDQVSFVIAPQ